MKLLNDSWQNILINMTQLSYDKMSIHADKASYDKCLKCLLTKKKTIKCLMKKCLVIKCEMTKWLNSIINMTLCLVTKCLIMTKMPNEEMSL